MPESAEPDEMSHQTEHFDGPILLHCLLHSGAASKKSRALLKHKKGSEAQNGVRPL